MPDETNPLFQSLTAALDYCRDTPVLHACVDMLAALVAHHSYTGHPDDECNYEESMRGDLECYYYTCTEIQEDYEDVVSMLMELPDGDPRMPSLVATYDNLVDKYGADSKK
jgi:hypothetical protein